ncbi:MAG: hypothetical protein QXL15_02735 [Candidatus Korarchaeota archaeon]
MNLGNIGRKFIDKIKKLEPGDKIYWFRIFLGVIIGISWAFLPGLPPRPSLFKFLVALVIIMFSPLLVLRFLIKVPVTEKSIDGWMKLLLWHGTVTSLFVMVFFWSLLYVALYEMYGYAPL